MSLLVSVLNRYYYTNVREILLKQFLESVQEISRYILHNFRIFGISEWASWLVSLTDIIMRMSGKSC